MRTVLLLAAAASTLAAQKLSVAELVDLARSGSPKLRDALVESIGEANIKKGAGVVSQGSTFVFAAESEQPLTLVLDDAPAGRMNRIAGSNLWYATSTLKTGTSHAVQFKAGETALGPRTDVPAFGPDSYEKPGVPRGTLSEKLVHSSKIYEGMQSDYWIYVPAQYNAATPAALMVWQDGQGLVQRDSGTRAQIVFDNLTDQKKIPVTIQVFISPGRVGEKAMRSILYDTVNDAFARFLRDEVLAEVQAKYNIRRDGYSRAIAGNSSGGICAFNVAWHQPDQFSRVLSRIGSFTSIQWRPGVIDGGNVYPNKVRKEPKRNIRVWLQDGAEDLENAHGSWPLQN
ncbi:MAG: alpha/beta hydrolase, partial [Bryobacteraceae bacterium]